MTKSKLITRLITCFILLLCGLWPLNSFADTITRSVVYYIANPQAPNGFEEKARWHINSEGEWNRFVSAVRRFKVNPNGTSPMTASVEKRPAELIVISDQNKDLNTVRDYYLWANGVMIAERTPRFRFFNDTRNLYGFLKDQQKYYSDHPELGYDPKTPATLKITYNISNQLSNPAWYISKPNEVAVYFDFLKEIKEIDPTISNIADINDAFNQKDTFTINILAPSPEYDFISSTNTFLRFGKNRIQYSYLIDEKKYFDYFRTRAMELLQNKVDTQTIDSKLRGQF